MQFLPHLLIPFSFLEGYLAGAGGTLAFIKISLRLFCLLYAVIGGSLNTSLRYLFCPIMDLQCFAWIVSIGGSLGSYFTTNTGLWFDFLSLTLRRAIFLGIFLALATAESIRGSG